MTASATEPRSKRSRPALLLRADNDAGGVERIGKANDFMRGRAEDESAFDLEAAAVQFQLGGVDVFFQF